MASFNFEAITNCHNITIKRGTSSRFSQDLDAHKISNNLILSSNYLPYIISKQHTQYMLNKRLSDSSSQTSIKRKRLGATGTSRIFYFCLNCSKQYSYLGELITHLINTHAFSTDQLNEFYKANNDSSTSSIIEFKSQSSKTKPIIYCLYNCEFCSRIF